jgi:Bacterial PH domain
MSRPILPHVLIALGVLLFLILIALAGHLGRPRSNADGRSVLFRHNAIFRGFAYFSAFGITIGLTAPIYLYPPQGIEVWYILGLYAFFGVLTLPLVWEASRFYVLVTPNGIESRSAWRGRRLIAWEDIGEVSFSSLNAWFVFRSTSGDTIRAHAFVAGLKDLVRMAESQVPLAAMKRARLGYERLGLPFPDLKDEPTLEALPSKLPGEW